MTARPRVVLNRRAAFVKPVWTALRPVLRSIVEDHELDGVLSVALVDDAEMTALHAEFLGDATPTDVITFPLSEDGGPEPQGEMMLGEVVVSSETALREAGQHGNSPARELALYAIHGALHLAGFDDRTAADRRRMRRAEDAYLEQYDALVGPDER